MNQSHPATPAGDPVRVSDTRAYISEQSPDADSRSRVAHEYASTPKGIAMRAFAHYLHFSDLAGSCADPIEAGVIAGATRAYAGVLQHITGRRNPGEWAAAIDAMSPVSVRQHEHDYRRTATDDGYEYVCDCGAHCPHEWPDDIREEGGGHHCLLCGADGLA